jgi:GNAT superfamily N-acetyltransferase
MPASGCADPVLIEEARPEDLPAIITIMGEGQVPKPRESWSEAHAATYRAAFDDIRADPRMTILVARAGGIVAGYAITDTSRTLGGHGMRRVTLHSLFVAAAMRGRKIGAALLAEVERRALAIGAGRVDLTSDKLRLDAHRFYRAHGYQQSQEGFKKLFG